MSQTTISERAAVVTAPPRRTHAVRAASLNEEDRSFDAVVASEQPVGRVDFRSGTIIDEVLLASGGIFPDSAPLLDAHRRDSTSDIVGSVAKFRREDTAWIGSARVAMSDPLADAIWSKIRDGHLTSLSIGYSIGEFEEVAPGESKVIAGRTFANRSERTMRVVTSWPVHEVSLVPIPADENAKIRSAIPQTRSTPMPATAAAAHSRQSLTGRPTVGQLTSGMMMRCGISDPSQHRVEPVVGAHRFVRLAPCDQYEADAEVGKGYVRGSLIEVIKRVAELDGVQFSVGGDAISTLRAHYQRSFLGSNLEALFTGTFGSLFLDGYDSAVDTAVGWTSEADNLNLQPAPRVRPSSMTPLKRRGHGARAEAVEFTTVSEDTQLAEYAGRFLIDEADLIDNQFGNWDEINPRMMGAAARQLRSDLVYSILLGNPNMRDGIPLFHADHGNLQVASPMDDTTLGAALAMMSKQIERGVSLNLRGRYLIVPQSLERAASKLAREVELTSPGSMPPALVRSDARIDNGVIDPVTADYVPGQSASWYVAADGASHTVEVQYLAGTDRQPKIRNGLLKEGRFGVWFDVQHFIGAQAMDWRGLVKSEG